MCRDGTITFMRVLETQCTEIQGTAVVAFAPIVLLSKTSAII